MIGYYNVANLITLCGLCCALGSMACAADGRFSLAAILLVCSAACDMVDGAVARRLRRDECRKTFGVQLDSLCDMVSFGAAPAVLGWCFGPRGWFLLPLLVFIVCGAIRLAWFNMLAAHELADGFRGLPIPVSAIAVPTAMWLRLLLPAPVFPWVFGAVFAVTGVLYITNFKLKKPKGGALVPIALAAAALVVSLIVWGGALDG